MPLRSASRPASLRVRPPRATQAPKRVRPAELVGDLPCGILKKIVVVFVQPDPHPARVAKPSLGVLLGHLTAMYCLIEER
jgi:hypothetical protein